MRRSGFHVDVAVGGTGIDFSDLITSDMTSITSGTTSIKSDKTSITSQFLKKCVIMIMNPWVTFYWLALVEEVGNLFSLKSAHPPLGSYVSSPPPTSNLTPDPLSLVPVLSTKVHSTLFRAELASLGQSPSIVDLLAIVMSLRAPFKSPKATRSDHGDHGAKDVLVAVEEIGL
ncbi:hypothetical protein THAOC_02103 [Thalassiosira oceanica]|uniref:Uncharacterized protein n=1 Tax=Thalassiosira oceanica TaxID=159749 RepID=K0TMF0_THAOC|nr:hypothetical protein THAOC_02103 [Thalassiosira oceanica]|eukprot:EJK76151.1 hypothetical protein THAOC_02103 [Thalassiosira oceanica]